MFLSYFLYLNALFAQSLFVYDAVMLALLQIFKLPFGSQISNIANRIDAKTLGTSTNIISYTTYANAYIAPNDGYVQITCYPTDYAFITCLFDNIAVIRAIGISNQQPMYISCFARKGTKIHFTRDALAVTHGAAFISLQ